MTKIYRYVLASDDGMAPNPRGDFISLATCKPGIRQNAEPGHWVLGNFPSPNNEIIAWAGVIARTIPVGQYGRDFAERMDALYPFGEDGLPERHPTKLNWYHRGENERRKDMKGMVLLFDSKRSWYFGGDGRPLPSDLAHLAARNQGYRVKKRMPGDAERLEDWLNKQGLPGIHGEPRDGWAGPEKGACSTKLVSKGKRPVC